MHFSFWIFYATYLMRTWRRNATQNFFSVLLSPPLLPKKRKKRLSDNASLSQPWKGKFCPFHSCLICIILQHNLTDVLRVRFPNKYFILSPIVSLASYILFWSLQETACHRALSMPPVKENSNLFFHLVICRSPDGKFVTLVCDQTIFMNDQKDLTCEGKSGFPGYFFESKEIQTDISLVLLLSVSSDHHGLLVSLNKSPTLRQLFCCIM